MNDASVMHFSMVLEVPGGLLLPGKNINNSFADAGREVEEELIHSTRICSKDICAAHNISCSVTHLQCKYLGI